MELKPEDLSISTIQNGSNWFPKFNGVRIRHIPSGIEAESLDERGEHANKAMAMQKLKDLITLGRFYEKQVEQEDKIVFYIRIEWSGTDTSNIGKIFRFLRSRFPYAIISKVERLK